MFSNYRFSAVDPFSVRRCFQTIVSQWLIRFSARRCSQTLASQRFIRLRPKDSHMSDFGSPFFGPKWRVRRMHRQLQTTSSPSPDGCRLSWTSSRNRGRRRLSSSSTHGICRPILPRRLHISHPRSLQAHPRSLQSHPRSLQSLPRLLQSLPLPLSVHAGH